MKGCPFCGMIKEELKNNNIMFVERDIHDNEKEYDKFVEMTQNEFIPAFMLLTINEKEEWKKKQGLPNYEDHLLKIDSSNEEQNLGIVRSGYFVHAEKQ